MEIVWETAAAAAADDAMTTIITTYNMTMTRFISTYYLELVAITFLM